MGNKVELKKQVTPDRYYIKVILEDLLNYYFPKEVGRFNLEVRMTIWILRDTGGELTAIQMRNEQWVYFATRALTEVNGDLPIMIQG